MNLLGVEGGELVSSLNVCHQVTRYRAVGVTEIYLGQDYLVCLAPAAPSLLSPAHQGVTSSLPAVVIILSSKVGAVLTFDYCGRRGVFIYNSFISYIYILVKGPMSQLYLTVHGRFHRNQKSWCAQLNLIAIPPLRIIFNCNKMFIINDI